MSCQPQWIKSVYIWLNNIQTCLLCGESAPHSQPLCMPCKRELPWLGAHCQRCALPLPMAGLTCGRCLKHPPAFHRVICPWRYAFAVDTLIIRFKHQSKWPLGHLLAGVFAEFLQDRFQLDLNRPDLLLPVPLSTRRFRQRGFNQAAMLAQWLGTALKIPCNDRLLIRAHDTQAQQSLKAKARRKNLLKAFSLAPGATISGLHLALVDDVLTTGGTAQSLALLLLKAGARQVDVYCLARTPQPGQTA